MQRTPPPLRFSLIMLLVTTGAELTQPIPAPPLLHVIVLLVKIGQEPATQ